MHASDSRPRAVTAPRRRGLAALRTNGLVALPLSLGLSAACQTAQDRIEHHEDNLAAGFIGPGTGW